MEKDSDQYYIDKVKQGEVNYYSILVDKYKNIVFSIALKVLGNREDAEEMAQEVFVKAYSSIHSFRGESKFSTWLFRITYNSSVSGIRKKKPVMKSIDENSIQDETEEIELDGPVEERKARLVKKALEKLDADDYSLIVFYYYDNQSVEEIAGITKLSESNVKVRLHRARKKLHAILNIMAQEEKDILI